MRIDKEQLYQADRKWRLNLVNSLSGIKPANLIGTRSKAGLNNLAIFSSVVHLGSNPAQLGFVLRPQGEVPRHTFENILETGFYTINHIQEEWIRKAHYTSAKLDREESEFERMQIEKEFIEDFHAPFVKESPVKIGMKFNAEIALPNGCSFIVGDVLSVIFPDEALNDLGQLDLVKIEGVGISGLNSYYSLEKLNTFPYVRTHEIPDFK
ncbi:MAG: flavin reductase [Bacteroidota bacterium]